MVYNLKPSPVDAFLSAFGKVPHDGSLLLRQKKILIRRQTCGFVPFGCVVFFFFGHMVLKFHRHYRFIINSKHMGFNLEKHLIYFICIFHFRKETFLLWLMLHRGLCV